MPTDGVRISEENPWYWEYDGEQTLLLGASDDDCLFQWFGDELTDHLDDVAAVGGNYLRNTMSIRYEDSVFAFETVTDDPTLDGEEKVYDLESFNDEFFDRLETFLTEAAERDIVVEFTLWDQHDFGGGMWDIQPWNPERNVNYDVEETGVIGGHEFFSTLEDGVDEDGAVLEFQERYVEAVLDVALAHDNVIFNVNNESTVPYKVESPTSYDSAWERHWADYVHEAAAERDREADVASMVMSPGHSVAAAIANPERYTYVETSQLNQDSQGKVGQDHWDAFQDYRVAVDALGPRPLNNVKVYGATDPNPSAGAASEAVERFWRLVFGGAASARFHRPGTYGLGLVDRTKSSIRSMRMLEGEVDLFAAEPATWRLANRDENEAYATASEGEAYAVYFPDGGEVAIDLGVTPDSASLRWLDVERSAWHDGETVEGEQWLDLEAPGEGNWVVAVDVET
ncbi:MAG: hypothetical protein ABEJ42_05980 [Halobacteriaceae archaeon]